MSTVTGLSIEDIVTTLEWLEFLRRSKSNGPKEFVICIEEGKMRQLEQKYVHDRSNVLRADPEKLLWKPVTSK